MVNFLRQKLQSGSGLLFTIYAILASFCTYSCMYAFRKPFAVGTFENLSYWDVDYKVWLITFQVLGYTLSKFIGIKIISEMGRKRRGIAILILIGSSGLALLGFALIPPPWNIIFLFLNGLPLGMVWGLVFSYLEGRKMTEALGAGLSVSFIFSSGLVRSVGKHVLVQWNVSEFWMPVITGALFLPPLLIFVWMLEQIPPPNHEDQVLRTRRHSMDRAERVKFFKTFALGLILLVAVYMLLSTLREFRDNFSAEIWQSLGFGGSSFIFTATEIPVSLGVLLIVGSVMLIKDNYTAFKISHLLVLAGMMLIGLATWLFELRMLNGPVWMTLVGLGLYIGFVSFNSMFFDRLIATFKYVSNVGFLIYLADAFGYLGSIAVLFFKEYDQGETSWLDFFMSSCYFISIVGSVLILGSWWYFDRKYHHWKPQMIN